MNAIVMEPSSIATIAGDCGGELLRGAPETLVRRACSDSRQVQSEDLFVALRGDRFDGHDYLKEAARKGAAAVLAERERLGSVLPPCGVVAVGDSRAALGEWARHYRRRFDLPVVAVAGSNGKTTTKELIAAVLGRRFRTLASEASFNNDVGVPLTLLRLDRHFEAAVLEAGTNHPGELEPLLRMIQPRYGVLTSLGREHLEFFGGLDGVVREEGWLAELLPSEGTLFVPGDSPSVEQVVRRTRAAVARVGWGASCDWRATAVQVDERGTTLGVEAPQARWSGEYRLRLLGRHQVTNALLALAVGAECGLEPVEMRQGLAACLPPNRRLQLWDCAGVKVLDDSYNANADSMCAALEVLRDLARSGRRVAVLGDMAEQGVHSQAAHAEVGAHAATVGVTDLFAVGECARGLGQAARVAGVGRVVELADADTAAVAVREFARPGDWVLVKASRAMRLERVVEELRRAAG